MNCPECKRPNLPDATFCGYCGARMSAAQLCASCGNENPPHARFCHRCGSRLERARAEAKTLRALTEQVFVGRQTELSEAERALEDALAGAGRFLLISGAAGMGKSRLAEEIAALALRRGALVLQGRCREAAGAPAYLPWIHVVRCYIAEQGMHALLSRLGADAADIAEMIPEVRDADPDLPTPPSVGPQQARFRLFDALVSLLLKAAHDAPVVVTLDDIHQADKPSLLLLQLLANEMITAPMLVVATYRDAHLAHYQALAETIQELDRRKLGRHIRLEGLPEDEVGELVAARLGRPPPDALVKSMATYSDGNPFFVNETVRLLTVEGELGVRPIDDWWAVEVPQRMRQVLERRLEHLSADCNRILSGASVIGRDFRIDLLERISVTETARLVALLEEAIAAGIVTRDSNDSSRYRFSHALIRDAFYDEIDRHRRADLHRKVGDAMLDLYGSEVDKHYAELAHHFVEAASTGDGADALRYSAMAGDRAAQVLGYEEAAAHYERALEAAAVTEVEPEYRCDLLLALGDARWRSGGTDDARKTFQEAADLALELADARRLADAALGYGAGLGGFGFVESADGMLIGLLEEALQSFPTADDLVRVRLLSRLAVELYYTPFRERRAELSEEALTLARRLEDPEALLIALYSRHWSMLGPDGLDERLAAADEILELAREVGDREMAFRAHHFRISALLELGRIDEVDDEIEIAERLAEDLRQPLYRWQAAVFRAMRALMKGRFDEGEKLAQDALSLGRHGYEQTALVLYGVQTLFQYWGQGRLVELVEPIQAMVGRYPWSSFRSSFAWLHSELGHDNEAREHLEIFGRNDFADVPRDGNWLITLSLLAIVAAHLRDNEKCAVLYDLLLPYRDRVVVGSAATLCTGSTECFLAILAGAMQRWDDAETHFDRALAVNSRIGIAPMMAYTCVEYARALIAKDDDAGFEKILMLINRALQTTVALGMDSHTERILALKLEAQGVTAEELSGSIHAVSLAVQKERPSLSRHASASGEITILLTDIAGSTAMTERVGEQRAHELLLLHNAIVREEVQSHGGRVIKSLGDGFLIVFTDPRDGLECAIATQRRFAEYNERQPDEPLRLRVGLHRGTVIREDEDFYGRNMILATRIANEARGDQILVSEAFKRASDGAGRFAFDAGRDVELKGLAGKERVYEVLWR
ncbi:MAG: AAA family ATPase [Actinomycetota bacterium]|nr:AAA family ATPase [Actinomycetota bacterium]